MANKKLPMRAVRPAVHTRATGAAKSAGPTEVLVQDPTNPLLILPLVQTLAHAVLAVETVKNSYELTVVDSVDISIGDHLRVINLMGDRYYFGFVLDIIGNTITMDTPIDFEYVAGSDVTLNNINMAVDGSVTPVHFHLRTGEPSIPSSIDITRMLMVCETDGSVDLNKFGDLTALTRGIVFRNYNDVTGEIRNYFNIKANRGLVGLAYDFNVYSASNPSQGINGFAWRLTFGSSGKMGAVIRVDQYGQLGIIVQDDLTDLVSLTCIVEGHVTVE